MKKKILLLLVVMSFAFFIVIPQVLAHPGRTAADGCHYCRTNCDRWGVPWGERHCHGGYLPLAPLPSPSPIQTNLPSPKPVTKKVVAKQPTLQEGHVSEVIDGDTIRVRRGFPQLDTVKIRLIGIDTPESKDPRKPVECFAEESKKMLEKLIKNKEVTLKIDPKSDTIDKYGRLLRIVYYDDLNVNQAMVGAGYAYAYTKYPFSSAQKMKDLEAQAKREESGLWSDDTCNGKRNPCPSGGILCNSVCWVGCLKEKFECRESGGVCLNP